MFGFDLTRRKLGTGELDPSFDERYNRLISIEAKGRRLLILGTGDDKADWRFANDLLRVLNDADISP